MNPDQGPLNFVPPDADQSLGLQVAPLVDIVFLLICFFTFTSQLIQIQKDASVTLPLMKSPQAEQEVPADFTVNLRPDGALTVDGRPMSPAALGPVLAGHMQQARAAGQRVRVVIRADHRQKFARLDEILEVCRRTGLAEVIFRARGEE
jgi:biopolymer transport protein ExbD